TVGAHDFSEFSISKAAVMISTATVVALLDNSPEAATVLDSAHALLARDMPTKLHVVHVVEQMSAAMERYLFPYACFGDDRDAILSDLLEAGRAAMNRRLSKHKNFSDSLLRVLYGRVAAVGL